MDQVYLSKAPISEAIVEIGVKLPADVTISSLKSLHGSFSVDYPNVKERRGWESKLINEQRPRNDASAHLDGYMFGSIDNLQVVQFRLDGFAFNRLRPYMGWESLIADAKKYWQIYLEGTKAPVISRLAVRYLNVLELPMPVKSEEYLKVVPSAPAGYPGSVGAFVTCLRLMDSTLGIKSDVTQAMAGLGKPSVMSIFLDIDVSKEIVAPIGSIDIWGTLQNLRDVKNQIFFNSITQKTVELYR